MNATWGVLKDSQMMFDHVKHVQGQIIIVYHIYDSIYYKVMFIDICKMQFEDTEAQCILWQKLNAIILKNGVTNPNFKGFMLDNVEAN